MLRLAAFSFDLNGLNARIRKLLTWLIVYAVNFQFQELSLPQEVGFSREARLLRVLNTTNDPYSLFPLSF